MQIIKYPERSEWKKIVERPSTGEDVFSPVQTILKNVKEFGDEALRNYSVEFDKVLINDFVVSKSELEKAGENIDACLKTAINIAAANIKTFHKEQLTRPRKVETMPGIQCWRKSVGIEKIGLYIPGGTAPLFSTLLMLAIPAKLAGCKRIIVCTPPDVKGKVHPAILYTAEMLGVYEVYKVGGAQAIAAMAYGTESIPAVYKIFGPGNQYVTTAKQLVQMDGVAIDLHAGPSELAIYADECADPRFIAADILSQAEHGIDSQILFVTTAEFLIEAVMAELEDQLEKLPRKSIAKKCLQNSKCILLKKQRDVIHLLNDYAPEHLIIASPNPEHVAEGVINAGSVFIGSYSPESVGDYASGTNHALPTNGFARATGGVSVDSFAKKITYQKLNHEGLKTISDTVITMAEAEGLFAHANAVKIRLSK